MPIVLNPKFQDAPFFTYIYKDGSMEMMLDTRFKGNHPPMSERYAGEECRRARFEFVDHQFVEVPQFIQQ